MFSVEVKTPGSTAPGQAGVAFKVDAHSNPVLKGGDSAKHLQRAAGAVARRGRGGELVERGLLLDLDERSELPQLTSALEELLELLDPPSVG